MQKIVLHEKLFVIIFKNDLNFKNLSHDYKLVLLASLPTYNHAK